MKKKSDQKEGARERLKKYFESNVGKVLEGDDLRAIAGISEWARRIRELKSEYGMNIQTHNDQSDLKPGQYVLVDLTIRPQAVRNISKEVRARVLDRDGATCQMCGIAAGDPHPSDGDKPARMHLGHIIDKSAGGSDDVSNLRCLCSVCNEGIQNISLPRPQYLQITTLLRRAPSSEQVEVLKWLVGKYKQEVLKMIETEAQH